MRSLLFFTIVSLIGCGSPEQQSRLDSFPCTPPGISHTVTCDDQGMTHHYTSSQIKSNTGKHGNLLFKPSGWYTGSSAGGTSTGIFTYGPFLNPTGSTRVSGGAWVYAEGGGNIPSSTVAFKVDLVAKENGQFKVLDERAITFGSFSNYVFGYKSGLGGSPKFASVDTGSVRSLKEVEIRIKDIHPSMVYLTVVGVDIKETN